MVRARSVTIRDVARDAGVAVGTVSKVLNGNGQFSDATRQRVLQSVERLQYVPNAFARSLNLQRSYTVGLLTNDSFGRFSMPILLGAEDALGTGQMSVFLCDTRDDHIREAHYIRRLLSRKVDGFIVTGRYADARQPIDVPDGFPVVYAMTPSADPDDVSLRLDNEAGGRLAVECLLTTGRHHIAHVSGTERHESATARFRGAREALDRAGRDGTVTNTKVLFGNWTEEWGRQAAQIIMTSAPETDGIFAGSDQVARGVIEGLAEFGRRVPDDVGVIGYDNWDVMVSGRRPTLSTIDPRLSELGRRAAESLMRVIAGERLSGTQWISPQLVIGESTRPRPPARH